MTHPNAMTAWPEIRCQRGHEHHETRQVHVSLGGLTAYRNYSSIPESMATEFDMLVWDWEKYPVDGGSYCPAHDAVSETIGKLGVWEPRETILAIHAFRNAGLDDVFVDMGAQLGWYSILAMLHGVGVVAYECDPENARVLWENTKARRGSTPIMIDQQRIGASTGLSGYEPYGHVCLAKIDVEGAERDAVRMLGPSIEAGLVDRLLVEISPVFDDYYGDLVVDLLEAGYNAYLLPLSHQSPVEMNGAMKGLIPLVVPSYAAVRDHVNTWHQEDVYFVREGIE